VKNLKQKGIEAFTWDLFGKVAIHGSTFLTGLILARLLTPADFGLIAMIMVLVSTAAIFSDIGLGGALIQRKHLKEIHYSSVFYFNVSIGMFLTLSTYLLAPLISNFYVLPALLPLIQVSSLLFTISAFHTVQNVILRKQLNYRVITQVNFFASIFSAITGITLALFDYGVWSLVYQLLVRELMVNLLIWSKTTWSPTFSFSFKALKQLWSYGFNMFLAELLDTFYEKIDYLIIGKLFSPSILGYFYQAKQLNNFALTYISGSLMSVLFPLLSKIQKEHERFQRVVKKAFNILLFFTFLLLGTLYLVSDELILLLLGEQWQQTVQYFKIFILSGFAYPISALMVDIISSRGKSKIFLQLELYKKVIQSITLVVLYFYGIEYFLYSIIFTSAFNTYLNIHFAMREIKLPIYTTTIRPFILQMILSIGSVYLTHYLYFSMELTLTSLLAIGLKSFIFISLYIFINIVMNTTAFQETKKELQTLTKQRIKTDD